MQKATKVKIRNSTLNIEEEGVAILDSYLNSIRQHFGSYRDGNEIIEDIETRISEKALKLVKSNEDILSVSQIQKVVSEIGQVNEMDEVTSDSSMSIMERIKYKIANFKLLRDMSNRQIAGVCSGLGMYFNVDPVVFRLVFGLILIFGLFFQIKISLLAGAIYIVLWAAMPEAKTPVERIEMKGQPVTLTNIAKEANTPPIQTKLSPLARFATLIQEMVASIYHSMAGVFKIGIRISGFMGIFGGLAALFGLILVGTILLLHPSASFIRYPFPDIQLDPSFNLLVILGFVAAALPTILFIQLSLSLIKYKSVFKTVPTALMILVTVVAAAVFTSMMLIKRDQYVVKMETNPANYEIVERVVSTQNIEKLTIIGNMQIRFVNSDAPTVKVRSNRYSTDLVAITDRGDGKLTISRNHSIYAIQALDSQPIIVEVSNKDWGSLLLYGSNKITAESIIKADEIVIADYLYSDLSLTIDADRLNINNYSAEIVLAGTVNVLNLNTHGIAPVNAKELKVKVANLEPFGPTKIQITVSEELNVTAIDSEALVTYYGNPVVNIDRRYSSELTRVVKGQ